MGGRVKFGTMRGWVLREPELVEFPGEFGDLTLMFRLAYWVYILGFSEREYYLFLFLALAWQNRLMDCCRVYQNRIV